MPQINEENMEKCIMSTCKRLDLETLGSRPLMHKKISPDTDGKCKLWTQLVCLCHFLSLCTPPTPSIGSSWWDCVGVVCVCWRWDHSNVATGVNYGVASSLNWSTNSLRVGSHFSSHSRSICWILTIESFDIGAYHFTRVPSPKSQVWHGCQRGSVLWRWGWGLVLRVGLSKS